MLLDGGNRLSTGIDPERGQTVSLQPLADYPAQTLVVLGNDHLRTGARGHRR
jgi:hypothetical protein